MMCYYLLMLVRFILIFICVGGSRSSSNQMRWIPYSEDLFRIFNSIWYPCTRGFGRQVSISLCSNLDYSFNVICFLHLPIFKLFLMFTDCTLLNSHFWNYAFVSSYEEEEACKKILEKMGLTGYQVTPEPITGWGVSDVC